MPKEELTIFLQAVEYTKECWNKAPEDVKHTLLGGVFGSLSILWKLLEVRHLDKMVSNECLPLDVIRSKTNKMFGIGLAVEVVNLASQYWRLKEFTAILKNATNLRDESRRQVQIAIGHLQEVEKLILDFDANYRVPGKQITGDQQWEMCKMKDDIYDKLNEVKICLSVLEVRVGTQIEILQMKQTGILVDSVTGIAAGAFTIPQTMLAVGLCNPFLLVGAAAVAGLRIGLGVSGLQKYEASLTVVKELQQELNVIQDLGRQHKVLKENFQRMAKSICLRQTGPDEFVIYVNGE